MARRKRYDVGGGVKEYDPPPPKGASTSPPVGPGPEYKKMHPEIYDPNFRKEPPRKDPDQPKSDMKRGGSVKGDSKMKHEHHMKHGGHVKHPEHHAPKHHPEHMTPHVHHHKHGGHVDSHKPHHEHIRQHYHGK